jgi:hypothetical protein
MDSARTPQEKAPNRAKENRADRATFLFSGFGGGESDPDEQSTGRIQMRAKTAFLAGAGAAYFFDPETGKRRRHVARDRALRAFRQLQRGAVKKAKLAGGHAYGLAAVGRRAVTQPAVAADDETVAQRIRSDALRDLELSTKDIDVRVDDGFAVLRGSVASIDEADRLVRRVRKVPGVRDVSAEVRVAEG